MLPTPTPTVTPSPSQSVAAAGGCLPNPSACGYPDASNTGAHGTLTVVSGKVVVTVNGTTIANEEIQGCVQVKAANVVLTNVRIDGGCLYSLDLSNATGHTTVTDVTILATNSQLADAVLRDATVTRANVSGGQDGIDSWGDSWGGKVVVRDSYIHDLGRNTSDSSHDDTLQISGGDQTFEHNTLIPYTGGAVGQYDATRSSSAPVGDPMNSCLQIGALQGNLAQMTFDDNLCDGGNFSLNANSSNVGGSITAGPLTYTNNRFGRDYRYGLKTNLGSPFSTTWSGNVDDATGNAV